jgi:hypothetical protein
VGEEILATLLNGTEETGRPDEIRDDDTLIVVNAFRNLLKHEPVRSRLSQVSLSFFLSYVLISRMIIRYPTLKAQTNKFNNCELL